MDFALKPVQNIPEGALFPASATAKNANRRQHTADDRWRALQREVRALPEIGGRKRKQQKLLVLAAAGALRDERHHPPKVAHGLGLVLVITIADVRLPIALGVPPGLAARRPAVQSPSRLPGMVLVRVGRERKDGPRRISIIIRSYGTRMRAQVSPSCATQIRASTRNFERPAF